VLLPLLTGSINWVRGIEYHCTAGTTM
jgi:hypothetical protein